MTLKSSAETAPAAARQTRIIRSTTRIPRPKNGDEFLGFRAQIVRTPCNLLVSVTEVIVARCIIACVDLVSSGRQII